MTEMVDLQHEATGLPRPGRLNRFARDPRGMIPALVLLFIILATVVGPMVWVISPTEIGEPLSPMSKANPLGTDELGRDVLARLLVGGRVSLLVGLGTMVVIVVIGVAVGATGGFFGGRVDAAAVQLIDGLIAVPSFFLWLIALSVLRPSELTLIFVLGLTSWTSTARVVRGEVLRARSLEFVSAARSTGASSMRLLIKHCLPQATSATIVAATLAIAFAILMESALSFLGLGVQPPSPSWGNMLGSAQQYVFTAPDLAIYPGIAIALTVLCLNLLGDALRDVLDPRDRV